MAFGETALLQCGPPRGNPEPNVVWKKDGHDLEADGQRIKIIDGGNLMITNVLREDEGRYQCIAHNLVGSRETPTVTLTVHGNFIYLFLIILHYDYCNIYANLEIVYRRNLEIYSHIECILRLTKKCNNLLGNFNEIVGKCKEEKARKFWFRK